MTTWQINIDARSSGYVDMSAVLAAVADLVDGVDQDNEHNSSFIRVAPGHVAEAVARINALGYLTDEDED